MCRFNFISAETAWPGDNLHIFYWGCKFVLLEKSLKLNWFFCWKKYCLQKYSTRSIFLFLCDLSYNLQTYIKQSASYMTITDQFQVKDKSRVFQDKYLIWYTHLRNRVNRDTLKIHEFDRAPSPVSPSNSSFNNSLFSIFPPPTIETSCHV